MARLAWTALLAVAAGAAAPTDDQWRSSTLVLEHEDGSVPPPYHHEWRLELRPDGTGRVDYWAGYRDQGVVPATRSFTVPAERRAAVVRALRAAGVGARSWRPETPPRVGGASNRVQVQGPGVSAVTPGRVRPDDERSLGPAVEAFERAVPDRVWAELGTD